MKNFIVFKQSIYSVPYFIRVGCLWAVFSQYSHYSQLLKNCIMLDLWWYFSFSFATYSSQPYSIYDRWQNFSSGISNTFVNDVWIFFQNIIGIKSILFQFELRFGEQSLSASLLLFNFISNAIIIAIPRLHCPELNSEQLHSAQIARHIGKLIPINWWYCELFHFLRSINYYLSIAFQLIRHIISLTMNFHY